MVAFCTLALVLADFDDCYHDSLRMAVEVDRVPRNSRLTTLARRHRPRLFGTPEVVTVAFLLSELPAICFLKMRK